MTETKRMCLALDLKDDPKLIEQYKQHHLQGRVWPEVTQSIKASGIVDMEIFCTGNRLFMIVEANETFDPEAKQKNDAANAKVQEWERLMSTFQAPLPWAKPGEKWVPMTRIFKLEE